MAKTNKTTKATKFNATLTIPALTISTKTLLELARLDRNELEDYLGDEKFLPTLEAMLQNPKYMEHLQKAIVKLLSKDVSELYEDSDCMLPTKQIKNIFKAEIKAATDAKKKYDDERRNVLNGDGAHTAVLKISGHDLERVKQYLGRCDMPFVQVAPAVAKSK